MGEKPGVGETFLCQPLQQEELAGHQDLYAFSGRIKTALSSHVPIQDGMYVIPNGSSYHYQHPPQNNPVNYTSTVREQVIFTPPQTLRIGIPSNSYQNGHSIIQANPPISQLIPQPPLGPRKSKARSSIRRAAKVLLNKSRQALSSTSSDSNLSPGPLKPGHSQTSQTDGQSLKKPLSGTSRNRARMGDLLNVLRLEGGTREGKGSVPVVSDDISIGHRRKDVEGYEGRRNSGRRYHSAENVNAGPLFSSGSIRFSGSEVTQDDTSFDVVPMGLAGHPLRRSSSGPIKHTHKHVHHRGYHTADSDSTDSSLRSENHHMAVQTRIDTVHQAKTTREALRKLNRNCKSFEGPQHHHPQRNGPTSKPGPMGPLKADHNIQPFNFNNGRSHGMPLTARWKEQGARPKCSSTESLETTESVSHEILPDTAIRSDPENHRGGRRRSRGSPPSRGASPSRSVRFEDEEVSPSDPLRRTLSAPLCSRRPRPERTKYSSGKEEAQREEAYRSINGNPGVETSEDVQQRLGLENGIQNGHGFNPSGTKRLPNREQSPELSKGSLRSAQQNGIRNGHRLNHSNKQQLPNSDHSPELSKGSLESSQHERIENSRRHLDVGSDSRYNGIRTRSPRTSLRRQNRTEQTTPNGSSDEHSASNGSLNNSALSDEGGTKRRTNIRTSPLAFRSMKHQIRRRSSTSENDDDCVRGQNGEQPASGDEHYSPISSPRLNHLDDSGKSGTLSEELDNTSTTSDMMVKGALEPAHDEIKRAKKTYSTHANHYHDAIQAHNAWDEYKKRLEQETARSNSFALDPDHCSKMSGSNTSLASNSSISDKMQHLGQATRQKLGRMRRALSLDRINKSPPANGNAQPPLKRSPSLRSLSSFLGKKKDKLMGSFTDLSSQKRSSSATGLNVTEDHIPADVTTPSYMRKIGRVLEVNDDGTQLVRLVKPPNGPFGFYIAKGASKNGPGIFVKRIGDGHPAKILAGLLQVGDEIVEINSQRVKEEKCIDRVYDLILDNDDLLLKTRPLVRRGDEIS